MPRSIPTSSNTASAAMLLPKMKLSTSLDDSVSASKWNVIDQKRLKFEKRRGEREHAHQQDPSATVGGR